MAATGPARRLTSIMAADVVGYSRLVEADEAGTARGFEGSAADRAGTASGRAPWPLVKLMGDGLIAEFGSVVEAVACAAAIQMRSDQQSGDSPAERRIVLRIGINLGDVVVEGDDLLGDGVNVAARLEQVCPPGGILISGMAHDQLPGKLDCRFEYAGEQRLKNIARPMRAYRMMLTALPLRKWLARDWPTSRRWRCCRSRT